MKTHEMAARCPVCGGTLEVIEARCAGCEVGIHGRFRLLEFNRLSPAHLELLRLFIRTRGNLKEIGRIQGVSYPTARARFEELFNALGYEEHGARDTDAVLDALEAGDIDGAEAARQLTALRWR